VRVAAVALLALLLAAPAFACTQHPTQGAMEAEFVCPECHTPLDESNSPIAQQMKAHIRTWIAAGWSECRIRSTLLAQFGPAVLGVPRTHGFDLLAWALPLGGAGLGALALAAGAWAWSRNRSGTKGVLAPGLTPEQERRVDEELARFDA